MVSFSGCSSDTKESLNKEYTELLQKCNDERKDLESNNADQADFKALQTDCINAENDIYARMKALKESGK